MYRKGNAKISQHLNIFTGYWQIKLARYVKEFAAAK